MELSEEQVIYKQGYWDGILGYIEFLTKQQYPNALDEVIDTHVNTLFEEYREYLNESIKDD